jgi:WD40 repeat protein
LEDSLVRLSDQIPYVGYGDFLYGRKDGMLSDHPTVKEAERSLQAALEEPLAIDRLAKLADHSDPRVRTLALLKLYALENHDALRVIHRHLGDSAATFPMLDWTHDPAGAIIPATEPATVGGIASLMLKMTGYPAHWEGRGGKDPTFEAWSAKRLGNPEWIGWYDFLYKRATGGRSPIPAESAGRIAELRKKLDACPFAVRAWMWFGVADDCLMQPLYDTPLATEAEMVEAGKKLGAEALLAFLRDGTRAGLREPKADDPERGRRFILSHAKQLFREQDSEALAAMGQFTAAADANPKSAPELIRRLLGADDRPHDWDIARGMAALLDLRGDTEAEFVVKWFYDTPSYPHGSSAQSIFIDEYQRRRPAAWQRPASMLVGHPAFERLPPLDLIYLGIMVNQLSGQEIVPAGMMHESFEMEARNRLRAHFGHPEVVHRRLETPATQPVPPSRSTGLPGESVSLAMSPDGELVAVGRDSGSVLVFETKKGEPVGELPVEGAALVHFRKPDGVLMVITKAGLLTEWDAKGRKQLREVKLGEYFTDEMAISDDGGILATRFHDLSVYDLKSGKPKWTAELRSRAGDGFISLSPDGTRLAVCDGFERAIQLFDAAVSKPIATMNRHSGVPAQAYFSPDGKLLLTTGSDSKIVVWDGVTGEFRHEYRGDTAYVAAIGFAADSRTFFVTTEPGRVSRIDATTGLATQVLEVPGNWLWKSAVSPDGRRLAGIESSTDRNGASVRNLRCWRLDSED